MLCPFCGKSQLKTESETKPDSSEVVITSITCPSEKVTFTEQDPVFDVLYHLLLEDWDFAHRKADAYADFGQRMAQLTRDFEIRVTNMHHDFSAKSAELSQRARDTRAADGIWSPEILDKPAEIP